VATWQRLLDLLRRARYGVIFYGSGLSLTGGKHHNLIQLFALVRDLHRHTRCVSLPLRGPLGHGNAAGAYKVLTWQTGYPFAVSLSRGFPRYGPGEFTTDDLLRRREIDTALLIGDVATSDLSQDAREVLIRLPRVVVGSLPMPRPRSASRPGRTAFTPRGRCIAWMAFPSERSK
jgi:formylmethanofuran dehydrogenase subunit B